MLKSFNHVHGHYSPSALYFGTGVDTSSVVSTASGLRILSASLAGCSLALLSTSLVGVGSSARSPSVVTVVLAAELSLTSLLSSTSAFTETSATVSFTDEA
ncbi:unnamed protein product [Leptidea sinapis]|uniref:Uncharacterized protein n=1 Tax=Leptidea sinapis TaxID=189913 RepID=A0A5E4R4Q9_9NEOP|nr:unnamed protein product [Leptidea sinapis]